MTEVPAHDTKGLACLPTLGSSTRSTERWGSWRAVAATPPRRQVARLSRAEGRAWGQRVERFRGGG